MILLLSQKKSKSKKRVWDVVQQRSTWLADVLPEFIPSAGREERKEKN